MTEDTYLGGYSLQGYPKDWPDISKAIRSGSGDRCHRCGIVGGQVHPSTGRRAIIQVAHLDHDKANCAIGNLLAMCHVCHSANDRAHKRDAMRKRRASAPLISAADIPQPKVTMTLDAYLRENNQSIFDFSVRNGINTNSVYRAARKQTVKWNTAKAISAATGGSVTISEIMD